MTLASEVFLGACFIFRIASGNDKEPIRIADHWQRRNLGILDEIGGFVQSAIPGCNTQSLRKLLFFAGHPSSALLSLFGGRVPLLK